MPASLLTTMSSYGPEIEDKRAYALAFDLSRLGLTDQPLDMPDLIPNGIVNDTHGWSTEDLSTVISDGSAPELTGANTTECVPVPSSEHVAEIVGRQGCKIKALRAKTNTYIKTPVRGEDSVFVVTGRPEDVEFARNEIMQAAEHFSQIRAMRKANGHGPPSPSVPGQTTIKVRVPYKVVGLVVGPKGATVKRIQQATHTYIVTPSREKEPVFEVTGLPEQVEQARQEIEQHIAARTGLTGDGSSGDSQDGDEEYLTSAAGHADFMNGMQVRNGSVDSAVSDMCSGQLIGQAPSLGHSSASSGLGSSVCASLGLSNGYGSMNALPDATGWGSVSTITQTLADTNGTSVWSNADSSSGWGNAAVSTSSSTTNQLLAMDYIPRRSGSLGSAPVNMASMPGMMFGSPVRQNQPPQLTQSPLASHPLMQRRIGSEPLPTVAPSSALPFNNIPSSGFTPGKQFPNGFIMPFLQQQQVQSVAHQLQFSNPQVFPMMNGGGGGGNFLSSQNSNGSAFQHAQFQQHQLAPSFSQQSQFQQQQPQQHQTNSAAFQPSLLQTPIFPQATFTTLSQSATFPPSGLQQSNGGGAFQNGLYAFQGAYQVPQATQGTSPELPTPTSSGASSAFTPSVNESTPWTLPVTATPVKTTSEPLDALTPVAASFGWADESGNYPHVPRISAWQ